jgi:hypothetical protein
MVGNQRCNTNRPPVLQEPSPAVERVQTGSSNYRCIPDIVQPRRGYEDLPVGRI